ncbi:uncharacterized protein N7484_011820 [Penicillium longicatenatum]|uniref:uncharacterized protein n=1 Tax=Penicillium longicatenatum TaxID=1561947 RepID=UPI0025499D9A|nr:uncharacterized protein N7484_011820 [Penicillium longicatenatum]KAJ5631720.1 hypothetical protein N7484_011820 [Penicillium longicatenatum]
MARTDIQYGREPVVPTSKGRLSSDSMIRSFTKKDARSMSRAGTEASWASKGVPSHSDLEGVFAPAPFPEYADAQTPGHRDHDSTTSTKVPSNVTPSEPWSLTPNDSSEALDHRSKSKHIKPKVHIKPMLRKMSRDDAPSTSIDLSRSSTEQEGLGIYMSMERDRRRSESLTGPTYRRASGLHHRSTSGTSQFSTGTGSSGGRAGSQYVYPLRPTPKAYTPPLSQSYQTSGNDSDEADEGSFESESRAPPASDTPRYVRASSGPVPRLSLQIEDDSFIHLPEVSSTHLPSRPSFGYSRDNGSTLDTTSPISRPSLDYVFRSRTRTSTDPVSRAATVQAARQAFEEKEAAKARRLEKQQMKSEERRRRAKHNLPGDQESPAVQSNENISEKPPRPHGSQGVGADQQPSASWKSQSKSTWVLFMTWLRTRVFKFRRKLRKMN